MLHWTAGRLTDRARSKGEHMSDHLEPHPGPSRVGQPPRCSRYARGHAPHPAQVQFCQNDAAEHWQPVVVMGAVGDVVTLAAGDELRRYRNHDPDQLTARVGSAGAEAFLNTRVGLLFLHAWPRDTGAVFSLQPAEQAPEPCRG
ncbi:hypothetical protein ACI79C_02910 [Geodermatophilus sp. SYSU D00697]